MGAVKLARCLINTGAIVIFGGLLTACVGGPPGPAPVILKGEGDALGIASSGMGPASIRPAPLWHRSEGHQIVVRAGQSVGSLAGEYHVPQRTIIAANHLAPPYKIEVGQKLVIPGGAERAPEMAALRPPLRPAHQENHAAHEEAEPEIISLDGPPPEATVARPVAAPADRAPPPSEPSAAAKTRTESEERAPTLPHGGQLPWPVHGRILAGYGVGVGGRHNDGINIGAPLGAPVRAVEGGVVAYAGNELRGYGNLVLVKHPDGLISAYAHCEQLLVKRGDKVTRGEVIAKVGETGGVTQPQLHFELRQGERAVDPRAFLAPTPSASDSGFVRRG